MRVQRKKESVGEPIHPLATEVTGYISENENSLNDLHKKVEGLQQKLDSEVQVAYSTEQAANHKLSTLEHDAKVQTRCSLSH